MKRRSFLAASVAATTIPLASCVGVTSQAEKSAKSTSAKFKLKYAPHLKTFKEHAGKDIANNIRFIADHGFRAIFDNKLMSRPVANVK